MGAPALHRVEAMEERSHTAPRAGLSLAALAPSTPAPRTDAGDRDSHRAPSLRLLVPGISMLVLALSLLFAAHIAEDHSRGLLVREMEARLVSEARQVALSASTALFDDFPELRLAPALREFGAGRPDLVTALVLDGQGVVRGDLDARRIGSTWAEDPSWIAVPSRTRLREGERVVQNDATLAVVTPVVHATGQRIGTAVVAIRRESMEQAIESSRKQQGVLLLAVLAMGSLSMLLVMLRLVSPVADLRAGLERIGRGDLDGRLKPRGSREFRLLAGALNTMAGSLRDGQREALERERLSGELAVAARLQRALLPSGGFQVGDFVVAGAQRAAAEVGGDYYDFNTRPDGRVSLVVADVAGKGLGGAFVTAMLASLVRAFGQTSGSPASLLVTLEKHLGPHLEPWTFITLWHGELDPDSGVLTHSSAGHLPALLVRDGVERGEWLRHRGIPLGIAGPSGLQRRVADIETRLGPGDLVVQVSDGITEAAGADDEQFGFERLEEVVVRHASQGPEVVVSAILQAVAAWTSGPPRDDETVLAIARSRDSKPTQQSEGSAEQVMAVAQSRGAHLSLPAELVALEQLREWLRTASWMAPLSEEARDRTGLALYELCANVLEHGYRRSQVGTLDVWFVPDDASLVAGESSLVAFEKGGSQEPRGFYVLRDAGRPFDPGRVQPPDVRDPAARRHGRGLGLAMARQILTRIRYYPNTGFGNLTVVRFDPKRIEKERS